MIHVKADVPVFAQQISTPRGRGSINEDRQPLSHYGVQTGDSFTVYIVPEMNTPQFYRVEMLETEVRIEARRYDTVKNVKQLLREQGCTELRLSHNGEELEDHHTLAYYQVENELLAFQGEEFPLVIENACKIKCQLVASPACTVASVLPRAMGKCRLEDNSDARLVSSTAVLKPEATLSSLGLSVPATLYLDKPFNLYITSSWSAFSLYVHFFDTVAATKKEIAQKAKESLSADMRVFWEMKELENDQRVGNAVPYENSYVSVLQQEEVLVIIKTRYYTTKYLPIGPQESVESLLKRHDVFSNRIVALVHHDKTLENSQPLIQQGVSHGDTLQGITEYSIRLLTKREFKCRVLTPAKSKSLKHSIKAQEHIPMKQQTLFRIKSSNKLEELPNTDDLDYPYVEMLLLLPGQIVLSLKNSDATCIQVAAALSDTVAEFKGRVQEANGIPSSQLRLYLGEQRLEDQQTLTACGLTHMQELFLFTENELLLRIHDSIGAVVDFLVRGKRCIKSIKKDMRGNGQFWFHYPQFYHLHLLRDGQELPNNLKVSTKNFAPGQRIHVVLEGERLLTIHTCYCEPSVRLYSPTDTIRRIKESLSGCYVEHDRKRLDDLYLNRNLLADTATLGECLPPKCELEYLNQAENYLIYVRDLGGNVVRVGVCDEDKSILALKRKWSYRNPHRPSSVKLLYKGKVLKDAYSLENLKPWCQLDLLLRTDWLVWVKPADRPSFSVGARPDQPVRSLKEAIKEVYLHSEPLRLVSGTTLLPDESIVSQTVLRNGGTVLLHDARSVLVFVHSHLGQSAAFVMSPSAHIAHLKIFIEHKFLYRRKHLLLTYNQAETRDDQCLSDFPHSDFLSLELSLMR